MKTILYFIGLANLIIPALMVLSMGLFGFRGAQLIFIGWCAGVCFLQGLDMIKEIKRI